MAIILLEGLDRTGKSTVAQEFKAQGYQVIHLSAPPKELSVPGYTGPSYLDQMVELITSAAHQDVVLDRTHYGELVWPHIYGRTPHLKEDDFEALRELEESVGVRRILMHDPNLEAHWQRCVDNKEPLTKAQFLRARNLYDRMAEKYGFEKLTLKDFVDVKTDNNSRATDGNTNQQAAAVGSASQAGDNRATLQNVRSPEQAKLEKANAINDILSKRIIKPKGPIYDDLEADVRNFLQDRLGRIFGDDKSSEFSKDEVQLLKLFCQRLKQKEK